MTTATPKKETVQRRPRVGDYVRLIESPDRVFRADRLIHDADGRLEWVCVEDAASGLEDVFRADQVETLSAAFMADWSL
jgi:hypothetical protein